MTKKSKGFMLVELIVTSTIVVTAMVLLYANFNKIYSLYKTKNNYYDVDGVYATKEMVNHLLKNDLNNFINTTLENEHYQFLIENGTCKDETDTTCQEIQELYSIKNMIFTEYDKAVIKKLLEDNKFEKETFKDYINYVISYYNISDSKTTYNYIILTEIEEKNKMRYSNLRIR